jgi:hypothetical protein
MGTATRFNSPYGVAVTLTGIIICADSGNNRIRAITPLGQVSTLAGNSNAALVDGQGTTASFRNPHSVAVMSSGVIMVADTDNNLIRAISPSGMVTTVAGGGLNRAYGDGIGTLASFYSPHGLSVTAADVLYVADMRNGRIRTVAPTGQVSTLAGSGNQAYIDGTGTLASFWFPFDMAVSATGVVVVADWTNYRMRMIQPSGKVSLLAGGSVVASNWADGIGEAAKFNQPEGVIILASGEIIIADTYSHRIRNVSNPPPFQSECAAGTSLVVSSGECNPCPIGFLCPNGTVGLPPPLPCPEGYFCPTPGVTPALLESYPCLPGYSCPQGSSAQRACPPGSYCPPGTVRPVKCPIGHVCASLLMPQPAACAPGSFCPQTALTAATGCPSGHFCPDAGMTAVGPVCPAGSYCPSQGMTAPMSCAGAAAGSTVCSNLLDILKWIGITAVSVIVLVLVFVRLRQRWQEQDLLELAQDLFASKSVQNEQFIERRALVKKKVVDLSKRIAESDLRQIGSGGFGSVSKGRLVDVDPATGSIRKVEDVVVKKPLRQSIDAHMENMQEISLLMSLSYHPHVLTLLGAYTGM